MSDYNRTHNDFGYERPDRFAFVADALPPDSPHQTFGGSPARTLTLGLIILLALALGVAVAQLGSLPDKTLVLVGLTLCGALGALAWTLLRLPVKPILCLLLPACLTLRFEINLFPIFKYNESLPGLNVSLMLLTSVALLLAHCLERLRGKEREQVFPLSFSFFALALLLWCGLGVLGSTETRLGFYAWFSLASCLLFTFALANEYGKRERLRALLLALAVMIGINGLVGVLQATTGLLTEIPALGIGKAENRQAFGDGEISRAVGLQEMANSFAWFLVTLMPTVLAVLILRVRAFSIWQKRLLIGAALLGLLALILTYARGSWLAFVVAMVALVVLAHRVLPPVEQRHFRKQIAVLVLFGLTLCLPFIGAIYIRLTEDDNGSAYSRVPLSQVAQAIIADNPLLGVGLSNYEAEMRRYDHTPERITDDFPWPVHNIFLHQAAEAGLPALLFFFALVSVALWQGFSALRSHDRLLQAIAIGLICGLLAYFTTGLKELGSFGSPQLRLCFLTCGLLLAVGRVHRQQIVQRTNSPL
jgi:O-antigen ligase